jgi:manganese/zinc/iron transport system permease protein
MIWTSLDNWIVATAVLSAASCGLIGSFLLLRRMSMMGDAISHAILPGLAAAFLITQTRASLAMFIGAAVVGVLTALLTHWIHALGRVDESASMGVVFTSLFAIGLIMIVRAADKVDLDPGCVLYGAIELTPLDTVPLFGARVPRAVLVLGATLVLNALFVALFYKELRITSFDPALATTLGINATLLHYALMTLIAVTTVASFESVGSILVMAMLIVPAATAHLLTDRYGLLLLCSVVFAALAAALGHLSAITVPTWFGFADTTTAGAMAVVAGVLFSAAFLFAPRYGILSRLFHRAVLSLRIAREDILGSLYRMEESPSPAPPPTAAVLSHAAAATNPLIARLALLLLRKTRKVARPGDTLTPAGRRDAQALIRAHRLWESYVSKHFELPVDHLHDTAERTEHFISPSMEREMVHELDDVTLDPQGKPIPTGGPEPGARHLKGNTQDD